jgi:hypothetical protein
LPKVFGEKGSTREQSRDPEVMKAYIQGLGPDTTASVLD